MTTTVTLHELPFSMSFPQCFLRLVTPEDWDSVLEWRNHPAVRHAMYHSHVVSAEEHYRYCQAMQQDPSKELLLGHDTQGRPLGVVNFTAIDPQQSSASWGFYAVGAAGQGNGTALTFSALRYAFEVLQLYKLNAEVLAFNHGSQRLHRKFGFRSEGIWRQHYLHDGQRSDIHRFALFAQDWHWLQARWQRQLYGDPSADGDSNQLSGQTQSLQASIPCSGEDALGSGNPASLASYAWHYYSRYLLPQLWAHWDGHGQALPLRQTLQHYAPLPCEQTLQLRLHILSHFQHSLIGWLEAHSQDTLLLEAEIEYPYASGDL